jgi:radical SAM protein with 4Fe4S-binding SPASM domain
MHESEAIADCIDQWPGNRFLRLFLKKITKRCPECGRRAENSIEAYATGNHKKLCFGCLAASVVTSKALDIVIRRSGVGSELAQEYFRKSLWRKGLASVLEGIAEFGPEKPFTAYAPFLVVWNITRACNLRCRHCYEFAENAGPDEMNTAHALATVDAMEDAGVAYIAISGGEPLMRKDLFTISDRIKEKGMGFSIATNGTLLTRENVKKLVDADCLYAQISLDGSTAASHNWFRGKDSFERTIAGIKNSVEGGLPVGISMTVTRHNYSEVPDAIDLAERLGASTFMHYNFIPTGRGKDISDLDITPLQREQLLTFMAKRAGKRKISLLSTAPQYGRVCAENESLVMAMTHFGCTDAEMDGRIRFLAEFIGGCGTGRLYCAMEPNGDIKPCVFIPEILGNIQDENLLDMWHHSEYLKKLRRREDFNGNCGSCGNRNICGGCRARALAYSGDIQASDPGCLRNGAVFTGRGRAGMRGRTGSSLQNPRSLVLRSLTPP